LETPIDGGSTAEFIFITATTETFSLSSLRQHGIIVPFRIPTVQIWTFNGSRAQHYSEFTQFSAKIKLFHTGGLSAGLEIFFELQNSYHFQ
jgi:hypothetical protein